MTADDSFFGELEQDQDTEDFPKTSMPFTGTGEDDTCSCNSAEYCDEVAEPLAEPLVYNESPSDSQPSFESQKDSKKKVYSFVNSFVSVESPPDVVDTSESEKDSSSTKEHTVTNPMDSSLKKHSTPTENLIQDPARKSVLELFNMIPSTSICSPKHREEEVWSSRRQRDVSRDMARLANPFRLSDPKPFNCAPANSGHQETLK